MFLYGVQHAAVALQQDVRLFFWTLVKPKKATPTRSEKQTPTAAEANTLHLDPGTNPEIWGMSLKAAGAHKSSRRLPVVKYLNFFSHPFYFFLANTTLTSPGERNRSGRAAFSTTHSYLKRGDFQQEEKLRSAVPSISCHTVNLTRQFARAQFFTG